MSMTSTRHIPSTDTRGRAAIARFLQAQGLLFDEGVQFSVAVYDDNEQLVGTGSFDHNTIKCVAIDESQRGLNLTGTVITQLINEQYRRGITHVFLYTKPTNLTFFADFGFYVIAKTADVALLENKRSGVQSYLDALSCPPIEPAQSIAGIVMNANPFTLGHRHLVETASKAHDVVHLFMVEADRSEFSTQERYELIKQGIGDLPNVYLHRGGDYIISAATFPSYFLKDTALIVDAHARLDIELFCQHIAPALGITTRYVGTEPTCQVTNHYNQVMTALGEQHGLNITQVERLQVDGQVVSASRVRALLSQGELSAIKPLVPPATYAFLAERK